MIDPQLEQSVVPYMIQTEKRISEKMKAGGDRPWLDFADYKGLTPAGKFDFAKLHENFNRKSATDDYASKRKQRDAQVKDIQTSKLSIDFLSGCERDWRMRTRSRVRMFVHAEVTSPAALGDSAGPLRKNTIDWMSNIMVEEPDKQ
jgi:hypothetical protein